MLMSKTEGAGRPGRGCFIPLAVAAGAGGPYTMPSWALLSPAHGPGGIACRAPGPEGRSGSAPGGCRRENAGGRQAGRAADRLQLPRQGGVGVVGGAGVFIYRPLRVYFLLKGFSCLSN
jgi:hypothetical protein